MPGSVVEISPESEIKFELSSGEATPKAVITLKHPGGSAGSVAFKVKTTQPRRYLVRPNQGIITAGKTEEVQILLVEKDKNSLYQSFLRLGQAALDNCKDKFLVQSTFLRPSDSLSAGDYDGLTEFWTKLASNPNDPSLPPISNKKLTVIHTGISSEGSTERGGTVPAGAGAETELEQMKKKYDELVAFSVNLTAERDVLNNTLEQTKRDLNRYMAKAAAKDNSGGAAGERSVGSTGGSSGFSFFTVLMVALIFWLAGCYSQAQGKASFLQSIPVLGSKFESPIAAAPVTPSSPPKTTTTTEEL
uniref:MSP domain-containing protein n=1 Tax=Amphora coffeiformis TaxID=265554 RepID=A0A7S3LDL8_9STRA|mmetsp:Transcript_5270/g.10407  ORF Transcript_5270/g.10407 Transcript_5270/m.10407 type:complete len:304 (-) Transcript_5270:111-1022(-)|eukprot:scaffold2657_cov89-Amphora_coffeaeformis.AAC.19